ncbi:Prolyl 4-hydroxylase subunit alpha-1, partial [Orchesella cincta]
MTLKGFSGAVSVNNPRDKLVLDGVNSNKERSMGAEGSQKVIFRRKPSVSVSVLLISLILLQVTAATVGEAKSDLQGKREDLFSSTSKLEDLVEHELQIVELLETFVDYTVNRANIVKSYIKSQKQFLLSGRSHPREIVGHPVDAYLLVRRLTADWEDVQLSLQAISNYSTGE